MTYKLTHAETKTEIEANADQVAMYESQGYETAPTANPPAAADEKKK